MGMGRKGVIFLEDEREWRLPGPLYADDLALCGELEEYLRVMVGQFGEVCRRGGLNEHVHRAYAVREISRSIRG